MSEINTLTAFLADSSSVVDRISIENRIKSIQEKLNAALLEMHLYNLENVITLATLLRDNYNVRLAIKEVCKLDIKNDALRTFIDEYYYERNIDQFELKNWAPGLKGFFFGSMCVVNEDNKLLINNSILESQVKTLAVKK
jgi:hypothetical protein